MAQLARMVLEGRVWAGGEEVGRGWGGVFWVPGRPVRRVGRFVTFVQGTRQGSISCTHLLICQICCECL